MIIKNAEQCPTTAVQTSHLPAMHRDQGTRKTMRRQLFRGVLYHTSVIFCNIESGNFVIFCRVQNAIFVILTTQPPTTFDTACRKAYNGTSSIHSPLPYCERDVRRQRSGENRALYECRLLACRFCSDFTSNG